ncbi:hypothetical protein [Nocardiopsis sp. M1B1]|uniref:hypothetical protein n=1 Tax=Nocardiopsis sp. M1B1 TaxID=3450454 RepID=UPI004039AB27
MYENPHTASIPWNGSNRAVPVSRFLAALSVSLHGLCGALLWVFVPPPHTRELVDAVFPAIFVGSAVVVATGLSLATRRGRQNAILYTCAPIPIVVLLGWALFGSAYPLEELELLGLVLTATAVVVGAAAAAGLSLKRTTAEGDRWSDGAEAVPRSGPGSVLQVAQTASILMAGLITGWAGWTFFFFMGGFSMFSEGSSAEQPTNGGFYLTVTTLSVWVLLLIGFAASVSMRNGRAKTLLTRCLTVPAVPILLLCLPYLP